MENDNQQSNNKLSNDNPRIFSVFVKKDGSKKFSRREFIGTTGAVIAGSLLVSCSPSPEPTLVPTNTPVPTATFTPPPTHTPTATSTLTPTATSTPAVNARVIATGAALYTGPSFNYALMGFLTAGSNVTALGRLSDNSWVKVRVSISLLPALTDRSKDIVEGWVPANQITMSLALSALPAESAPATPTSLPGAIGTIVPGQTGINYSYTDVYGFTKTFTLPCGSPIPAGAICTCNCVTVPALCSCNGYVAPTRTSAPPPTAPPSSGGTGLTQPCGAPVPPGYICTCNCVSR